LGLIFLRIKKGDTSIFPSGVVNWDTGGLIFACIVCLRSSSVYSFLGKLVSWRTQRSFISYVNGVFGGIFEGSNTKEPCGGNQSMRDLLNYLI